MAGKLEGDKKLSPQVETWMENAMLNNTKKSQKLLEAQAHSLARKSFNREQFQYGRWSGRRILNFAVRNGHRVLCDLLLEKFHVDPNLQDPLDDTAPLHQAAVTGRVEMIELLVNKYHCNIEAEDYGRSTPLCLATLSRQYASIQKLLESGASTEAQCFLGKPIHAATWCANITAMQMFHNANPNVVNSEVHEFCTPLVIASLNESIECFKYLAEVGDVNAKHLMYKVICCANSEESSIERVQILLDHGVNPNSYDEDQKQGEKRVCALKKRMLRELEAKNYLAADIICKVLHVDMDREEWDRYHSLCSFLIRYGMISIFPTPATDARAIFVLAAGLDISEEPERVLLGAKACMALEPDNKRYKGFLVEVTKALEENGAK